jgi:hypothetical protein
MEFSKWFKQNEGMWADFQHKDRIKSVQSALDHYLTQIENLEKQYQDISWKDPAAGDKIKNDVSLLQQTVARLEKQLKTSQPEDIYDIGVRVVHPSLGTGVVITPPHERHASPQIKFDNGEVRYVDQSYLKPLPKHLQKRI